VQVGMHRNKMILQDGAKQIPKLCTTIKQARNWSSATKQEIYNVCLRVVQKSARKNHKAMQERTTAMHSQCKPPQEAHAHDGALVVCFDAAFLMLVLLFSL
jgi:hypothetical protein